jgi:hypothetical protein
MTDKYLSKWRSILRWVCVLVLIGLGVQTGRLIHLRISRSNAQAANLRRPVSYTVTLREIVHAPDGTTTVSREITEAVRSDGSRVMGSDKGDRMVQFSSGLEVDTNDKESTKTSMRHPKQDAASLQRDPISQCLNSIAGRPMSSSQETFLGVETISGYQTAKIQSDIITSWYALDYGCALLKDRWEFTPFEVTEKELVSLVAGEPTAALFEIPTHYREVPPSERMLGSKKDHQACNEATQKLLQKLDENYKHQRVPQGGGK